MDFHLLKEAVVVTWYIGQVLFSSPKREVPLYEVLFTPPYNGLECVQGQVWRVQLQLLSDILVIWR